MSKDKNLDIARIRGKYVEPLKLGVESVINKRSPNLFNPNKITRDFYVNWTNGQLTSGVGFYASDFIKILSNQSLSVNSIRHYAFYDINKNYISGSSVIAGSDITTFSPINAVFLDFLDLSQMYLSIL